MAEEQSIFVTWESNWAVKSCPVCKSDATAHGWLFTEPKPQSPKPDTRKAIAKVYTHDGKEDCRIMRGT